MNAFTKFLLGFSLLIIKLPLSAYEIQTLFGHEESVPPIVQELIESQAMQRLKAIDQTGATRYSMQLPAFSRYEHSLGVYMLLRKYHAPLEECVAGLLHDTSHTVFSHVGDFLFGNGDEALSYQDTIHNWYLEKQGIGPILAKYALTIEAINPENPEFIALEKPLPDMCADRIEYNLHTAFLFGLMSEKQVHNILKHLHYENNQWFFDDPDIALQFAKISLYYTENLWAEPEELVAYQWMVKAMQAALAANELTVHEIHFSTDLEVLHLLHKSQNRDVQKFLQLFYDPQDSFQFTNQMEADHFIKSKFRGIDPLVYYQGKLCSLSSINETFAAQFLNVKEKTARGYYVKWTEKTSTQELQYSIRSN